MEKQTAEICKESYNVLGCLIRRVLLVRGIDPVRDRHPDVGVTVADGAVPTVLESDDGG